MAVVAELIRQCVDENAHVSQDQEAYHQRYEGLVSRFETIKHRFEDLNNQMVDIQARRDKLENYICCLRKQEGLISEFDEQLWYSLVDHITVYGKNDMKVAFKDGTVIVK